ncbi:MAG: hypothetical protein LUF02_00455 [Erysipelotrichaceae bacterium]|nr:hypothetical protein [Erysipelotrichaceae bacterium]
MTSRELYKGLGEKIKVTLIDGKIINGYGECFTMPQDNEPEIASLAIDIGSTSLIEVMADEVSKLELIG